MIDRRVAVGVPGHRGPREVEAEVVRRAEACEKAVHRAGVIVRSLAAALKVDRMESAPQASNQLVLTVEEAVALSILVVGHKATEEEAGRRATARVDHMVVALAGRTEQEKERVGSGRARVVSMKGCSQAAEVAEDMEAGSERRSHNRPGTTDIPTWRMSQTSCWWVRRRGVPERWSNYLVAGAARS